MRDLTANGSSTKWGTGILHNANVEARADNAAPPKPPTQ
jgi:hypothetical protein